VIITKDFCGPSLILQRLFLIDFKE